MPTLTQKKCAPCEKGTPPLSSDRAKSLLKELSGWQIANNRVLRKEFSMKDFLAAVALINEIAPVAQAEDHHPDLHLTGYRRLAIELSTHSIGGLSENDFIMAAKIDALPKELKA